MWKRSRSSVQPVLRNWFSKHPKGVSSRTSSTITSSMNAIRESKVIPLEVVLELDILEGVPKSFPGNPGKLSGNQKNTRKLKHIRF